MTELQLLSRIGLASATALAGDPDRADALVAELVAVTEQRGEHRFRSLAMWAQAMASWRRDDVESTSAALATSLRLKQEPGCTDLFSAARCFEAMAWVAGRRRDHRRAATLLGVADGLWTEIGIPILGKGHVAADHEACERQVREALGDAAFADAVRRGRELGRDEALGYALDERRPSIPPPPAASTPLTGRERQVAGLITEGLSNREIAARLVISRRTAESHVEHILAKLGFTSRSQVAAWTAASR